MYQNQGETGQARFVSLITCCVKSFFEPSFKQDLLLLTEVLLSRL